MFPDKHKKKLLNEGRAVGGKFFNYGGFPRVLKENIGLVTQYNDADDTSPKDEKIATQPDSIEELQKNLKTMVDEFDQAELDLSDSDYSFKGSRRGKEMQGRILDLERQIREHPATKARLAAAEAARAAEGPGFFSRVRDPDWRHDAAQKGEIPVEAPRERGLGLGPPKLPPTDYDLARSSRRDR